jgi:hypothetical protein
MVVYSSTSRSRIGFSNIFAIVRRRRRREYDFFYLLIFKINRLLNLSHWYLNLPHVSCLWKEKEIVIKCGNGEDLDSLLVSRVKPLANYWTFFPFPKWGFLSLPINVIRNLSLSHVSTVNVVSFFPHNCLHVSTLILRLQRKQSRYPSLHETTLPLPSFFISH